MTHPTLTQSQQGSAFLSCGLRPFFLGAAAHATLSIFVWGLGYAWLGRIPAHPGGPGVWHAYEMIFGFSAAALCGFLLTAVPSFTDTAPLQGRRLAVLFSLWCASRLVAWGPGPIFASFGAVCDLALLLGLLRYLLPALFRSAEHRSLGWGLIAYTGLAAGFHASILLGHDAMPWLRAGGGLLCIFIVLAARRIGFRLVNAALEEIPGNETVFVPKPPYTRIAVFCLLLHAVADFFLPTSPITAWLALAVGAAVFNLTNDWHVGRVLAHTRVLVFYATLWCIALGYVLMGFSTLAELSPLWLTAARHLALVGGIGLSTLGVFVVAGRGHTGHDRDLRPWFPIAAALILASALARFAFAIEPRPAWILVAALAWAVSFALYFIFYAPTLTRPRPDGEYGC